MLDLSEGWIKQLTLAPPVESSTPVVLSAGEDRRWMDGWMLSGWMVEWVDRWMGG